MGKRALAVPLEPDLLEHLLRRLVLQVRHADDAGECQVDEAVAEDRGRHLGREAFPHADVASVKPIWMIDSPRMLFKR